MWASIAKRILSRAGENLQTCQPWYPPSAISSIKCVSVHSVAFQSEHLRLLSETEPLIKVNCWIQRKLRLPLHKTSPLEQKSPADGGGPSAAPVPSNHTGTPWLSRGLSVEKPGRGELWGEIYFSSSLCLRLLSNHHRLVAHRFPWSPGSELALFRKSHLLSYKKKCIYSLCVHGGCLCIFLYKSIYISLINLPIMCTEEVPLRIFLVVG